MARAREPPRFRALSLTGAAPADPATTPAPALAPTRSSTASAPEPIGTPGPPRSGGWIGWPGVILSWSVIWQKWTLIFQEFPAAAVARCTPDPPMARLVE